MSQKAGWFGTSFLIGLGMAGLTALFFLVMATVNRQFKLNQTIYSDQMAHVIVVIGLPIVAGMGLVLGACWNAERRAATALGAAITMTVTYFLCLFAVKVVYIWNGPLL